MRRLTLAALGLLMAVAPLQGADALSEARRLYNAAQYEAAERAARDAVLVPAVADAARVVLGRTQLERFRQSADPQFLTAARESLRNVDPGLLGYSERLELAVGQGELLYLDDRFGAAAELFEPAIDRSAVLGAAAHERVLDWWATSLDRHAQTAAPEDRPAIYRRLLDRMRGELAIDPGSAPAIYWLAAAARGAGDLDRAWQAAIAGWVRASLAPDRGAAVRADLDRLVVQAIIPERAARLPTQDFRQAARGMRNEWDAFKAGWAK
jgi:hypothetical protein